MDLQHMTLEDMLELQDRHGKNLSPGELVRAENDLIKRQAGIVEEIPPMTCSIPAGAVITVVTAYACPFHSVEVVVPGTSEARIYDHASRPEGRVVLVVPAGAPAETIYSQRNDAKQMVNGLVVQGGPGSPALKVSYN